jgi:cytochrome P450
VFTLRLPWKPPLVVVGDPQHHADRLGSDPGRARAGEARRTVLPLAGAGSPFGADGESHEDVRSRVVPWFAAARVDGWRDELAEMARTEARRWPADRELRLLPRMRTLTTSILVQLVLGIDDPVRARAVVAAIRHLLWTPGNPPLPVPGRDDGVVGRSVDVLFRRRLAWVRRALPDDLDLDLDEWAVVFAAAQEPPAIALTNVVLEAARDRTARARMVAGDHEWLDRFTREVLRVRPPASGALRRLQEPMVLGDVELPAGTTVLASSLLLHRDPIAFPSPHVLDPERWVGRAEALPYFPFGDGARRCLGEVLARAELATVVPAVFAVRDFRVRPRPEPMSVRGTVLVPSRGGRVVDRGAAVVRRAARATVGPEQRRVRRMDPIGA